MPAVADDMQTLARRLVEPLRGWFLGYGSGYVSGTWTPTFEGTTIAGTYTYTVQRGYYVRIGEVVTLWGSIGISAISVAPTGNMQIAGLPFAAATVGGSVRFVPSLYVDNLDYPTNALEIIARVTAGASVISLAYARDNLATNAYPAANFTNTAANMDFALVYAV